MACQDIQEDAQAYLDNELSPARRAQVEGHLTKCAECRRTVDELKAVSVVMGAWSEGKVSSAFKLGLDVRLAVGADDKRTEMAGERETGPNLISARQPKALPSFSHWFGLQWKPLVVAATVFIALTAIAMVFHGNGSSKTVVRSTGDVIGAFTGPADGGMVADASALANVISRKAIQAQPLDCAKVAQSDVLYAFLVTADSQSQDNASRKLINLLANDGHSRDVQPATTLACILEVPEGLFMSQACAAEISHDPLYAARQYELQGRLKEAIATYEGVRDGVAQARAAVAIGALRLRLGDYDGAQALLEGVSRNSDKRVSLMASELLDEVAFAREAAAKLAKERSSAIATAEQWNRIGLLEVEAYDFKNAANSFMKAAGAAGPDLTELAREARFRSAWCDIQAGQISTGVYGFRSMAPASGKPSSLEYAAGIEQAVGMARIGQFQESATLCRQLTALSAPTRSMEALAYFQQGTVELNALKDPTRAAESLGRVASAGQGNLSYAAEVLLDNTH
jgi:anti-sigma factor RsiW